MTFSKKTKVLLLILGDVAIFYISLYLTLVLRYQASITEAMWSLHQVPFFYIHLLWIFIFYVTDFYDGKHFSSYKKTAEKTLKTMLVAGVLAILVFYLTPDIGIAPKTNLFIDIILLTVFLFLWRKLFWNLAGKMSKTRILFFGKSKEVEKLVETISKNPQLGYGVVATLDPHENHLVNRVQQQNIHLVVALKDTILNKQTAREFYKILPLGVSIVDFSNFYEEIYEKIPVSIVNEDWFLENLREIDKKTFEKTKRVIDIAGTVILGIPTAILTPFVALAIKLSSAGSVFYKQKRVGKNGKIFEIVKFRTMIQNAENNGAVWAKEKDERITKVGSVLRKTRIDELPQLWNILKGEMSFVGPRPERPEFVENLQKEIPHYAMRHIIKPGLSGWAQVKFSYGASVNDAMEKLQHELFYIKNRSLILDLAIAAKTINTMLGQKGR